MTMFNILLIVSMPFMNACCYTYIIYLGMKINSPKPTGPRKQTVKETGDLKAVSSFGNGKQKYSLCI